MSIAVARRASPETIAGQSLIKLQEILNAVRDGNRPDIYKMAKMFAPELNLIPVVKQWNITRTIDTPSIYFDGVYFGIFMVTHSSYAVASSDNSYRRSLATISHGSTVKYDSFVGYHGDDILPMAGVPAEYIGYGTSIGLSNPWGGQNAEASFTVSFMGFKLEELPTFETVVENLSGADFTVFVDGVANLVLSGDTFQFSALLGTEWGVTPAVGRTIVVDGGYYTSDQPYTGYVTSNDNVNVTEGFFLIVDTFDDVTQGHVLFADETGVFVPVAQINYYGASFSLKLDPAFSATLPYVRDIELTNDAGSTYFVSDGQLFINSESPDFYGNDSSFAVVENRKFGTLNAIAGASKVGSVNEVGISGIGESGITLVPDGAGGWVPALPSGFNADFHTNGENIIIGVLLGDAAGILINDEADNFPVGQSWYVMPFAVDNIYDLTFLNWP